jgi:hypothetical protein
VWEGERQRIFQTQGTACEKAGIGKNLAYPSLKRGQIDVHSYCRPGSDFRVQFNL